MNTTNVDALFARFLALASKAQRETERMGHPDSETQRDLNTLDVIFTASDKDAAQKAREHAAFVKVLRRGFRSEDAEYVKLLLDYDTDWAFYGKDEAKVMTRTDGTTGGFLASNTFAADIWRKLENASPVRQVVTVVPVRGVGIGSDIPVRSSIQTASRISSELMERTDADGNLTFGLDQVPVHEMQTMSVLSRHLLADSEYPLDREVADGAVQAFRLLEGQEFIKGDGVGEFMGLNNSTLPAANLVTCADSSGHTVTPDDILKLVFKSVAAPYIPGGKLLMNPKLLGTLRGLKATTGNTYLAPVQDSAATFMGIPVVLMPDLDDNATPAAGKIVAYFIHPLAYALVVREEVAVQRLVERYALEGKVGFMLRARTGGQVVLREAVARLTTA